VGDSDNDIPLFKASNGVAFSSDSEELKRYAKYIINGEDLRGLLDFIK
jgi:hydroxymethylpyrimidine pyrophosphatase-like HAD family hydrolase